MNHSSVMRRASLLFAFASVIAIGALMACASAPGAQSASDCERILDSTLARMDTSAHFPSQLSVDSTVKEGEIEGVVVSALTNDSLASAMLFLNYVTRRDGLITDRDGRFHFTRRVPGRVVIVARLIGYKTDSVTVDTIAGTFVKIALRVNPLRLSSACCGPLPKGSICV